MRLLRAGQLSTQVEEEINAGSGLVPALLLAVVFLLDVSQPADVVFSVLYVVPIISTISAGRPAATYLAFVASSVATVAAAAFGVPPAHASVAFFNRSLALLAQVIAAAAVIQHMSFRRQETPVYALPAAQAVDQLANLAVLLSPLPEALAFLRLDGAVHAANAAAQRLLGAHPGLVSDLCWTSLFPLLEPRGLDGCQLPSLQSFLAWPASGPDTLSGDLAWPQDGVEAPLRCMVTGMVLRDTHGVRFGALLLLRDVSAASAAERERDAFISMAAHELRAPLSTLRGYVQLAQSAAVTAGMPAVVSTLQKALRQADRLNRMIGELLDVARLHRGQIDLHYMLTDLEGLLRDAAEQRRASDPERVIQLAVIDTLPALHVDQQRLMQVFANLLDNALKYSPDGGEVEVTLRQVQGMAEVSVRDHGIGIPAEEQRLLFQQFYRGKSDAHRFSGLGVGLYISNQIIVQHGGRLSVRSVQGEGSIFTCLLPLLPPTGRLARTR